MIDRRSSWVVAAMVLAILACRVEAAPEPPRHPRGTVLKLEMPAPALGKAERRVRVYLPPSYSDTLERRRYPVVYLLHGWPGSEADWPTRGHAGAVADSLIAEKRIPEILLVCPDACGGHSGQYLRRKEFDEAGVLGPEPGSSRLLAEHSPLLAAERVASRLAGVTIYFDCGRSDEGLEDNRAFDAKLRSLGIAHDYEEFPGSHTWSYWRTHLRQSLIAVTSGMRR